MAGTDVNNDIENDSDSVLKPDISSDGAIRPFMFGPQHDSSEEEEEEADFSISPVTTKTSDYVAVNQTGCRAYTTAITCRAKGKGQRAKGKGQRAFI